MVLGSQDVTFKVSHNKWTMHSLVTIKLLPVGDNKFEMFYTRHGGVIWLMSSGWRYPLIVK